MTYYDFPVCLESNLFTQKGAKHHIASLSYEHSSFSTMGGVSHSFQ